MGNTPTGHVDDLFSFLQFTQTNVYIYIYICMCVNIFFSGGILAQTVYQKYVPAKTPTSLLNDCFLKG